MGTFHLAIQVGSPDGSSYEWMEALVDTGSSYAVVPAATLRALGVTPARKQPFKYADGRVMERDVGQTWVKINDQALVRVVVFGEGGDESLLGADTLEGFGLGVDPIGRRLVPMPGLLMSRSFLYVGGGAASGGLGRTAIITAQGGGSGEGCPQVDKTPSKQSYGGQPVSFEVASADRRSARAPHARSSRARTVARDR